MTMKDNRPAEKIDVLSSYELRLSSSFLSRHLNSQAAEKPATRSIRASENTAAQPNEPEGVKKQPLALISGVGL